MGATGRSLIGTLVVALQGCATLPVSVPAASPSAPAAAACCTSLERGVLQELNRARTNPERFASELEVRLAYFRGNIYRPPGEEVGMRTAEGADAVREAVSALRATRPLPPLRLSGGMSAGAADHVRDQGPRGSTGHRGRDGSGPAQRVNRYGRWFGAISENIQYGRGDAREVVAELLIDDGVANRGHRRSALDPVIHVAGVSCGAHATYGQMCVIVHATDYSERSASIRPYPAARSRGAYYARRPWTSDISSDFVAVGGGVGDAKRSPAMTVNALRRPAWEALSRARSMQKVRRPRRLTPYWGRAA